MKKNVCDERQLQQMSKIGTKSFDIIFVSCTLVIIVQLAIPIKIPDCTHKTGHNRGFKIHY